MARAMQGIGLVLFDWKFHSAFNATKLTSYIEVPWTKHVVSGGAMPGLFVREWRKRHFLSAQSTKHKTI
jgi:hypothetical protein